VGIRTALYPEVVRRPRRATSSDRSESERLDIRLPPDPTRPGNEPS